MIARPAQPRLAATGLVVKKFAACSLVFLSCVGVAVAQERQVHEQLLQRCSEEVAPDVVGIAELEAQCPGLEHAIEQLGYAAFISEDQLETLRVHGLVDLVRFAHRYDERRAGTSELEPAALESILTTLQQEQPPQHPLSWYGRLKKWLRSLFEQAGDESDSWLSRWLDDVEMSEAMGRGIIYAVIVAVIVLAIGVLLNELRAAGFWRGRGGRKRPQPAVEATEPARDPHTMALSDLDSLPLHEQPSMLLRMVAAQLMKAGRLRTERSLTHRELASTAAFEQEIERSCFGRVATLAERLLYGDRPVPNEEIANVVREGRALSARLGVDARSAA